MRTTLRSVLINNQVPVLGTSEITVKYNRRNLKLDHQAHLFRMVFNFPAFFNILPYNAARPSHQSGARIREISCEPHCHPNQTVVQHQLLTIQTVSQQLTNTSLLFFLPAPLNWSFEFFEYQYGSKN